MKIVLTPGDLIEVLRSATPEEIAEIGRLLVEPMMSPFAVEPPALRDVLNWDLRWPLPSDPPEVDATPRVIVCQPSAPGGHGLLHWSEARPRRTNPSWPRPMKTGTPRS